MARSTPPTVLSDGTRIGTLLNGVPQKFSPRISLVLAPGARGGSFTGVAKTCLVLVGFDLPHRGPRESHATGAVGRGGGAFLLPPSVQLQRRERVQPGMCNSRKLTLSKLSSIHTYSL